MGARAARIAAGGGLAITALGVVYAVAAMAGWDPAWTAWWRAVLHLGELAVVVAVANSVWRTGVLARVGSVLAALGQLLFAVAEIVFLSAPDLGDALFGVGPLLTGAGMICVGIAVLRARALRWRALPLLVGVWILVPVTPVLILTGGPPDPLALAVIAIWDALWAVAAISVLVSFATRVAVPGHERAAA